MSSQGSEAGIAQGQEIVPENLFLPRGQAKRRPAGQVNHGKLAQTGSCSWQTLNIMLPTENREQAAEQSGSTCTGESSTGNWVSALSVYDKLKRPAFRKEANIAVQ